MVAQLSDIPEEILLVIFRYLSTSDLLNNIRRVCSKFRRISNDCTLYERIAIDQTLNPKFVHRIFKRHFSRIVFIELKYRCDVNNILSFATHCFNLYSLKLIACHGQTRNITNLNNTVSVKLLKDVIAACPLFRELRINKSNLKFGLRNFLPDGLRLHVFSIKSTDNQEITDSRIEDLFGLEVLELQGVKLYNNSALTNILMNNDDTLRILKLDVWKGPNDGECEDDLMIFIGYCKNLVKLSLKNQSSAGITDRGLVHVSRLKHLKSLVITNTKKITTVGFMRLFFEPQMRNLQKLNLGRCSNVRKDVIQFIAGHCPNLRRLYLDQFGVDDANIGVKELELVAKHCPRLNILSLSSMDPEVGENLGCILKQCPNLASFHYFIRPLKNYFTQYDPVLQICKQELPKFKITCSMKDGIHGRRK